MLKILEDRSTPTCIVVECGGKLSGAEYDIFLKAVDEAIDAGGGKASAAFIMESSPSYGDAHAAKDDLKFGTHQYRKMERVAFIGDVKWVDRMVEAFGWMTRADDRTFEADQQDEGIAWACNGS